MASINFSRAFSSSSARRLDTQLTARIDSLVKEYELNVMQRAQMDAEKEQYVRQRSARIIGGIAVGAVLLSIFFLIIIWRDITRSNRYRRELEEANRRDRKSTRLNSSH